ncbi:hypothetical protein HYX16_00910 [Candidatus Woesearchaeota archaeon]|nr:hypothetical protein [Candidatus Woesearchaeota archaeon]
MINKHPRTTFFILAAIIAYFILKNGNYELVSPMLLKMGYVGTFIAGAFYTYSFTSPPAAAILLILGNFQNIYLGTIIASFGALLSDLFIYDIIKNELNTEIKEISQSFILKKFIQEIPRKLKKFVYILLGIIFVSSPLPDEIGIFFLYLAKIKNFKVKLISYFANAVGIFIFLYLGHAL